MGLFKSRADADNEDLTPKKSREILKKSDSSSKVVAPPSPARISPKLAKKYSVSVDEPMVEEFEYKGGIMYVTQHFILHDKKSTLDFKDITEIHHNKTEIIIKGPKSNIEIKFKKMKSEIIARGCFLVLFSMWRLNNPDAKNPLVHSPAFEVPERTEQKPKDEDKKKNIVAALTGIQHRDCTYRVIVKHKTSYVCCVVHLMKQTLRIRAPQKEEDIQTVKYGDVSALVVSDVPLQITVRRNSGTDIVFLINKVTEFAKDLKKRCTEAELILGDWTSHWCDTAVLKSEMESVTSKLMKIPMMGGSLPKMPRRSGSVVSGSTQPRALSMETAPLGMKPFAGSLLRGRKLTKAHIGDVPLENVIKSEAKEAISEEGDLVHLAATRARGPPRKRRPTMHQKKRNVNLESALRDLETEDR